MRLKGVPYWLYPDISMLGPGWCHVSKSWLAAGPSGRAVDPLLAHSPSPTCVCPSPTTAPASPPAELLVTEAAHVRMLRVLHDLFYQPMADGGFFPLEELQNIFPSLDELIEVHCKCSPPPQAQPGVGPTD